MNSGTEESARLKTLEPEMYGFCFFPKIKVSGE